MVSTAFSEKSVSIYCSTSHHFPEGSNLHTRNSSKLTLMIIIYHIPPLSWMHIQSLKTLNTSCTYHKQHCCTK